MGTVATNSPGELDDSADLPFREIAQRLSVPCWISDESGRIVWVNDAWLSYTGWDVERISLEGLRPLHDPEVYVEVVRRWEAVRAAGKADEMVFPLRGADGRLKPFRTRVAPLRDATGRISRWFGTNTDVSGEIETVARLTTAEEQWREVFERAGDAIFLTDGDGRLTEVNAAACSVTGYGRHELVGRLVFELIVEDERSELAAARAREESVHDWRLRRKDGSLVDLEISSRRLSDGRRLGVARDVSARRRAELVLSSEAADQRERADVAEQHLTRFWDASRDLFAIVSTADGRPRLINTKAWETTLGYSEPELMSRRLFDLVHPDDVERTLAMRNRHLEHNYFGFENRYLAQSGDVVWLSWNVVREGDLIYCSARDVTAEKRASEELERTTERLARARKMESIGQLTGGVAHDFNNLLMVMAGHADLLRGLVSADPRADRSLAAIVAAAESGQDLTRRLLAFSRRQRLKPEPIAPGTRVSQLQPLLAASLGPNVVLELDCPSYLWTVEVDAGELEAALINMAVNARDAMPNGGRFSIAGRNRSLGAIEDFPAGEFVEFAISDTGQGIAPDILAKVVEPYFTTKELNRGTGLGLSQVDGFVQQSGGRMNIESSLGQGTTISIWLPRSQGVPVEVVAYAFQSPARRLRILLVEDNPEVADVTAKLIEHLGHEVVVAGSASAALRVIAEPAAQNIDLLLSDIVMAGDINGLGLARRLRLERPNLRILLVTGYSREAEAIGDEFQILAKPYQIADLDRALRERDPHPASHRTERHRRLL
jgi:PAS domain S-box-containing protein